MQEKLVLGGGCFWCTEAVFQNLIGVSQVVSGYMGGHLENPTYKDICTGTSGHAEVIQINFDSSKISLEKLLEVFWTTHDPTTLNRQGNDKGTQYRSAIFYQDESQKLVAEASKDGLGKSLWDDPIVTEIVPIEKFYPAEVYHQDYYNRNGYAGYCRVVINPKVAKVKAKFAHLLKSNNELK